MNVSAINCTPIKPQVNFGKDVDSSDVERLYDMSRKYDEYTNSSKETPKKKSIFKTLFSITMAVLATYFSGKLLANKALELLPKGTTDKFVSFAKSAYNKVSNGLINLSKNEKHVKIAGVAKNAENALNSAKTKVGNVVKNYGAEEIIKKSVGIGSVIGIAPKVVTADGNNDGIADIAQEGVNAYKSALDDLGVVSDIIKIVT